MRNIILAGAAGLALAASPALADDHAVTDSYVMTEAQQYDFNSWSADQRTAYESWPAGAQAYYWTLEPQQASGWWMLTDPQRIRVYEMTQEQRTIAWAQINKQMSSIEEIAPEAPTATPAAQAPRFVRSEVTQTTPVASSSADGELPICSETVTDGCINAWEAGERGAGVTRPLQYWPGRPASEIEQPLPATQEEFEGMQKAQAEAAAKAEAEEDADSGDS